MTIRTSSNPENTKTNTDTGYGLMLVYYEKT